MTYLDDLPHLEVEECLGQKSVDDVRGPNPSEWQYLYEIFLLLVSRFKLVTLCVLGYWI